MSVRSELLINLDQDELLRWPLIGEEEANAVAELVRKADISFSEEPKKLEEEFKSYIGREYALACNNGTAAIHSAFFAIGMEEGDEVIAPSYTYWATAMPAAALGAKVVFVEVDPHNLCLDPEDFERKITNNTKAVIPVHLWGIPAEMNAINAIAKKHGVKVIEDCAHAHGASYHGKKVGALSDISCFSFQSTKTMPAGEGGMLLTDNKEYFERAVAFGHYIRTKELSPQYSKYGNTCFGFKYRMSPLHAAIARIQLKKLDRHNAIKVKNCVRLRRVLDKYDGFNVYFPEEGIENIFYENNVRYDENTGKLSKQQLIECLQAEGARVRGDRYPLLHQQAYFTQRGSNPDTLPITRRIVDELINFPTFPCANDELVDQYITTVQKAIEG